MVKILGLFLFCTVTTKELFIWSNIYIYINTFFRKVTLNYFDFNL